MDQCTVDAEAVPEIRAGDVATIIGKDQMEEITAEEVAEQAGTITNELLSRLGSRLSGSGAKISVVVPENIQWFKQERQSV